MNVIISLQARVGSDVASETCHGLIDRKIL